jgi:hypothetical protein
MMIKKIETPLPKGPDVTELIGGEIAGNEEAEEAEGDDRQALQPGRGRVGPAGRDRALVHHALMAHTGHHRHEHGEGDSQRTDDGIVHVGRGTRGPEEQRREQQPQADERGPPLRPGKAGRQGERTEEHQQGATGDVTPADERVAQARFPQATLLEQPARTADVDLVMVVGDIDYPGRCRTRLGRLLRRIDG